MCPHAATPIPLPESGCLCEAGLVEARRRLAARSGYCLAANLPWPGDPRQADSPYPAASLAEIVRNYAIRKLDRAELHAG